MTKLSFALQGFLARETLGALPLHPSNPLAQFKPALELASQMSRVFLCQSERIAVSSLAFHAEQRELSRSLV